MVVNSDDEGPCLRVAAVVAKVVPPTSSRTLSFSLPSICATGTLFKGLADDETQHLLQQAMHLGSSLAFGLVVVCLFCKLRLLLFQCFALPMQLQDEPCFFFIQLCYLLLDFKYELVDQG